MELIRDYKQVGKNDTDIAGGKGASLGEMLQAGIPVPPGFVLLATAFRRFLEETDVNVEIDAILRTVKHEEMHTVEHASEKIQALILGAKMPEDIRSHILQQYKTLGSEFVAVRSSATAEDSASAAWAGQLDTFLNTTETDLLKNVQRCWASLFTPRAIFYRCEKGLRDTKISVAVVVQKMVNSETSGIAFSVHPVTEDRNQLIIEAGFGLGEAVVSGQITPDSYVVTKEPREIIDKNISTKTRGLIRSNRRIDGKEAGGNEWADIPEPKASIQALSDEQILALADMIIRIENHYGFPCDIEWAMEGGELFITQSRPITTLSKENIFNTKQQIEKIFSRDFTLVALEMDYRMESLRTRPWAEGENPHHPYLIFWRNDGTSEIYFNTKGVEWIQEQLENKVRSDTGFLKEVEQNVREGIAFIRPLYEAQEAVDKKTLIRLVEEFMLAYPWIEAMWWLKSMSEEQLKDVDCSNIVALREETETLSSGTDIVIRKSLQKLYPTLGNLSAMISFDEIKNDTVPSEEVLSKRDAGFVLINSEVITEKTFRQILAEHDIELGRDVQSDTGDISGDPAYKGIYQGRVSRVMGHNDLEKVKDGDVLVSPMTMIDFVPIMKKAGAIVTDEGGMLSHAAIVARELKKPCVIGTKNATRVFKDGDMVEVDADRGVVRKLH